MNGLNIYHEFAKIVIFTNKADQAAAIDWYNLDSQSVEIFVSVKD